MLNQTCVPGTRSVTRCAVSFLFCIVGLTRARPAEELCICIHERDGLSFFSCKASVWFCCWGDADLVECLRKRLL